MRTFEVSLHGACVARAHSWAAQADEHTYMDARVQEDAKAKFNYHHQNKSQLSHINLHPHFRCRKGAVCRAALARGTNILHARSHMATHSSLVINSTP